MINLPLTLEVLIPVGSIPLRLLKTIGVSAIVATSAKVQGQGVLTIRGVHLCSVRCGKKGARRAILA